MSVFRIGLFGDGGTGAKTTFIVKYVTGKYSETYDPTIEDEFRKEVTIYGQEMVVSFLDTAGQEEYTVMRDQWIRSCDGFIVGYSITSMNSFHILEEFLTQIYLVKDLDREDSLPLIIIGNKCDEENKRCVTYEMGENFCKKYNYQFFETSAKENINVSESVVSIISFQH
eukprot:TRINITY_DN1754_c0_g1_i4.p1 TRINITY_DN1754_c0_g1~~TRINITY_DN1754_c0_g1_i4.p1  ORF type:complete len:170 (-),score=23.88 TRINITY_DN1754_c0_g1_i4:163-672(-)